MPIFFTFPSIWGYDSRQWVNWFKTAELEDAQHGWYAGMHPARPLFKGNMMINPKNMVVQYLIICSDFQINIYHQILRTKYQQSSTKL